MQQNKLNNMKKRFDRFDNDNSFDKKFNSIFMLSKAMIGVSFIITTILIIAAFYLGFQIITNPESVGQFFGKIIHGINSAK